MAGRRPLVGVMPLYDEERESLWMLPGYNDGITRAGGIPLMLPLGHDADVVGRLADAMDGFLFTGGHDVDPALYGETDAMGCCEVCPERDAMEKAFLAAALGRDRPVLGICRGIQVLNVLLGGSLYQDLPAQHPSRVDHHQRPPYDRPVHAVDLVPGSPLQELLGKDRLPVNSYHHQAVKELAPSLRPMAFSADGLVEAVWLPGKRFVWAVQWHPEFSHMVDADSRKIFARFVAACADVSAAR